MRTTLSITAAGFLTVLPSYFTHRDLFPSLMKYIQDCSSNTQVLPAFYLLGLLVNYNKSRQNSRMLTSGLRRLSASRVSFRRKVLD